MSILADEGFRPDIDSQGDIHFRYEGGHYFVTRNCDDTFFYIFYPAFWSIDDVDELSRSIMAANVATRNTKAAKIFVDDDLKDVSATAESLIADPADVRKILGRSLRCIRTAVDTFKKEMMKQ